MADRTPRNIRARSKLIFILHRNVLETISERERPHMMTTVALREEIIAAWKHTGDDVISAVQKLIEEAK